jgi:hypothetical protein
MARWFSSWCMSLSMHFDIKAILVIIIIIHRSFYRHAPMKQHINDRMDFVVVVVVCLEVALGLHGLNLHI